MSGPTSGRSGRRRAHQTRTPNPRGRSSGRRKDPAHKPFGPAELAARAAALPVVTYPDLPVSDHRQEIADAIRDHQVVIVAGETGSGKTTQLPKICLELGRGIAGMIGHTQPRRLAARAVAERIAFELGQKVGREPGDVVGYQVRFTDEVGPTTLIKMMTDGILLAEMGSDPNLTKYDTIIVDEAHERSLNIDFILGYLGRLLPKRPDLKVIITSATIDSERFQEHFEKQVGGHVPIIEVSGRTYPVEVRYRPLVPDVEVGDKGFENLEPHPEGSNAEASPIGTMLEPELDPGEFATLGYGLGENLDLETALTHAVDELLGEDEGDILVFLPGERDILDARDALADHLKDRYVADPASRERPNGIEVLPLFARLSAPEQHRIYAPHSRRRVILSTNIAETSLTVPSVRYVIDAGLARISRFSNKTKVQRLPIEGVSKASAGQRAGRAGRTSRGIAIRLYSERDYASRNDFTEPEILRTSLASVILQMKALGLGDVKDFPFLDAPAPRAVRDGVQLLEEIGALDAHQDITRLGRTLARLPIDPRLGRMLIEADRLGCASEVLVIVAALSIQDPRERPVEHQDAADASHARYVDKRSDFITYLNMWRYLNSRSRDMSGSAFRRLVRSEYFHYLRFREWRDIVRQLQQMTREVGIRTSALPLPSRREIDLSKGRGVDPYIKAAIEAGLDTKAADVTNIHKSILTGLLSNIGNWDEAKKTYVGARGTHFTIWPGSGLKNRRPKWVMAAELVETSRLFARTVASIEPEWVEHYARHLVKKSYSEPTWSRARGSAQVNEKVTLYGLTLVADRKVPLARLGDTDLGANYAARGHAGAAFALALAGQENAGRLTAKMLAREMFITNALVLGDWRENHHAFVKRNAEVMEHAEEMSERMRDPSLVPDESARYQFFEARVPSHVVSAAQFNKWWGKVREKSPHLLDFTLQDLVPQVETLDETHFPSHWRQGDLSLPLSYSFEPGSDRDGITVTVPLDVLARVEDKGFDWLVPGLRQELVVAMIRGLPKPKRRPLAPATQTGQQVLARMKSGTEATASEPSTRASAASTQGAQAASTSAGSKSSDASEEPDPYSLDASLERLRAWGGSSGAVSQQRKTSKTKTTKGQSSGGADGQGGAAKHAPTVQSSGGGSRAGGGSAKRRGVKAAATPQRFDDAFADQIRALKGVEITREDLRQARGSLPPHLNIGFQVVDGRGAIVGYEQSLPALQKRFSKRAAASLQTTVERALRAAQDQQRAKNGQQREGQLGQSRQGEHLGDGGPQDQQSKTAKHPLPREPRVAQAPGTTGSPVAQPVDPDTNLFDALRQENITSLPATPLPKVVEAKNSRGHRVRGYPTLLRRPKQTLKAPVAVGVAQSVGEANRDWEEGLTQMLVNDLALETGRVTSRWSGREALMLAASPYKSTEALVRDAQLLAMKNVVATLTGGKPSQVRDREAYEALRGRARDQFEDEVYEVLGQVVAATSAYAQLEAALQDSVSAAIASVRAETKQHADTLFFDGYLSDLPETVLPGVPRYLKASAHRVTRARKGPTELRQDEERSTELAAVLDVHNQVKKRVGARPYSVTVASEMDQIAMLLEELRVSLFAQTVGVAQRVSSTRVLRRLDVVERSQ